MSNYDNYFNEIRNKIINEKTTIKKTKNEKRIEIGKKILNEV